MKKTITQQRKSKSLIFSVVFLFGSLVFLNSCANEPIDELNKKINIALRSGNEIDEKEWYEFIKYAKENSSELTKVIGSKNEVDEENLNDLILLIANKRRNESEPKIFIPKKETDSENENAIIDVYIENSMSMDGYVKGTTEFEAALSDLLVQMQYKYNKENINVNFINTKIYPSKVLEVKTFVETLDPTKKPYNDGNRTVSKLNEILETILDSTNKSNVSILISDCIYSLGKGKDTEGALEFEKSLTKGAFLEKSKEFEFSTIIFKMNSKFDGVYYDLNNQKTNLTKAKRPYYFWIIGKDNLIEKFQKEINLKQLKGFENSYYLSNSQENTQPYHSILRTTNKIGKFRPTDKKAKEITSINEIEFDNGLFQFSVAINLKDIPVDESYLIDIENYVIPDGFSVISIEEIVINKLDKNDYTRISKTNATHFITIQFNRDYDIQDLKLELSNKIPSWVKESNSTDDRDVKNELDKTFGLLYLVQGVSEAYTTQNSNNKSYFKINIEIKK
jgi:hypothetical protein